MKYFTIKELSRSQKAKEKKIDNTPEGVHEENLTRLIDYVLDPLRESYGSAIYVNSGYRNELVNYLVGGSPNSHHQCEGGYAAADITTKTKKGNKRLFELAQELDLPFCQLINEKNYSWIHISYNPKDIRKEVFSKD